MNVNGYTSKASALKFLAAHGFPMASALSKPDMNPKVAKNQKIGVMSSPLHLAPYNLSGFQVCPMASAGCAAACLHTAGNPAYMAGKNKSRIAKTQAYMGMVTRPAFVALIAFEIAALERKATAQGMLAGVRLNATSDIAWERVRLTIDGVEHASLMHAFPDVSFYDYTKIMKRAAAFGRGDMPENYHLTFSRSESNESECGEVLRAGGNVAAVFSADIAKGLNARRDAGAPSNWHLGGVSADTVDGDAHDYRPVDGRGVIVALKAKGDALRDTSGFVIQSPERMAALA